MSKNTEIVKCFAKAVLDKDVDAIKEIVAENYRFKGPMMEMKSREEMISFVQNLPIQAKEIESDYIEQGNRVVKIFKFDFTVPPIGTQEMCEIFTLENDKIVSVKLFYDASKFPKPEETNQAA